MFITKAQRHALKAVFDRAELFPSDKGPQAGPEHGYKRPITYCEFRRTVHPGYDCIMVQWCGMWLGIEKDGYTHS